MFGPLTVDANLKSVPSTGRSGQMLVMDFIIRQFNHPIVYEEKLPRMGIHAIQLFMLDLIMNSCPMSAHNEKSIAPYCCTSLGGELEVFTMSSSVTGQVGIGETAFGFCFTVLVNAAKESCNACYINIQYLLA